MKDTTTTVRNRERRSGSMYGVRGGRGGEDGEKGKKRKMNQTDDDTQRGPPLYNKQKSVSEMSP